MSLRGLAITGIGTVSPLGEGVEELAAALDAGRSGLVEVSGPCGERGWAGRVQRFDPSRVIPPMRARRLDRASLFAVVASGLALEAAGLSGSPALRSRLGVVMGTASAGSGPLTVFLEALYRQGPQAAPPVEFPNTVANAPASHVSIELGLQGPNVTLVHGEAVIAQAVQVGRLLLASDRCSSLLLGAVDEWNPYYQLGYHQLGALREFRDGGGGTLLSEGATVLVAEPDAVARARGATILARILGASVTSVVGEPYRWLADPGASERVIRAALAEAGVSPGEVRSVWLSANGVEAMERAEAAALTAVFGARKVRASGLQALVGERAASGALTLAAATLAQARGRAFPFAGGAFAGWPEVVRPLRTPEALEPGPTLVLVCGFGGNLGAIVVGA